MSEKSTVEFASEMTIAAMGTTTCWISNPDLVAKFYRTIYKEIATCARTPIENPH